MKRTAVVTGGSRGIGRAIAVRLARDGFHVVVNYASNLAAADAVVAAIKAAGGTAIAVQADVSDAAQVARLAASCPADVLVNNAGVLRRGDLENFDESEFFDGLCRVNLGGVILPTRAFAEGMRERGYGRIVNISSVASYGTSMAGTTFYAATKAAVNLLTKRFALTLGPHGITVNAVAPGFILTDMVTEGRTAEEVESTTRAIADRAMVKRVGVPDDIANAVAFLASAESGFVSAQVLTVDGGRTDYIGHP